MKLFYALSGLVVLLTVVLYPVIAVTYSTGPPPGVSGAPDEWTCQLCHDDFDVDSGTGSVTIASPDTFIPGETVPVVVSVNNTTPTATPVQGFQITVRDGAGNHAGTWEIVDPINTRFSGEGVETHVSHTLAGIAQDTWTMAWVAPDVPGPITFYVAGNAANGDFNRAGDYIYTSSKTIVRSTVSNEDGALPRQSRLLSVYPNPIRGAATAAVEFAEAAPVSAALLDGLGRVVREIEHGSRPAGLQTIRFETAGLAAGTYFLEIRSGQTRLVRPVVVVR